MGSIVKFQFLEQFSLDHLSYPVMSSLVLLLWYCPVSWGCKRHQMLLCRGVRPPFYECQGYDTKQSDGEVPVMLELWGMQNTPLLLLLPGPLWHGVVAPDKGPNYGLNGTKQWYFYLTVFCI